MNEFTASRSVVNVFFACCSLLFAGCGKALSEGDDRIALSRAAAAVAFAEAELTQTNDAAHACACEGTGTVRSGDGLAVVPCPCGDACSCLRQSTDGDLDLPKKASSARRRRLLYFTATWCPTCRANDATLKALAANGWKVGSDDDGHIQVLDVDQRPAVASAHQIDVIPAWVLLDGETVVSKQVGVLDPFAVGRLFGERPEK